MEKPVGFNTTVGITSGYWATAAGYGGANGGYVNAGAAVTQYVVRLEDAGQMAGISVGDYVQLPNHSMGPNLTLGPEGDTSATGIGLRVDKKLGADRIVLTDLLAGATGGQVTSSSHGSEPRDDDYISIRRIFTIAKGRVGVN